MAGGLLIEASVCFEKTLEIMQYQFPESQLAIKLKSYFFLKQLRLNLTCIRSFWIGSLEGDVADYSDQFASCLAYMFDYFMVWNLKLGNCT